jgi:hypothetical protein
MLSVVKLAKLKFPSVALFIIAPSISTNTWSELLPRMRTEEIVPGPPFENTVSPWLRRSASTTVLTCRRCSSSPVMTSTALVSCVTGTGVFVAEMTTSLVSMTCSVLAGSSPKTGTDHMTGKLSNAHTENKTER